MIALDIILIGAGIFMLAGAARDSDWYMTRRRVETMSSVLGGRPRARVVYVVVGLGLIALGILDLAGVVTLG